jgi:glucokinase
LTGLTIGVDLGGTKVRTAIVDFEGNIVDSDRSLVSGHRDPVSITRHISEWVVGRLAARAAKALCLGVGVAGQIDNARGIVRYAPNLDWKDVPLGAQLQKATGLPAVVVNDVRAAAYGEWIHGAARDINNAICLFVGTGIGGGIIADGRLIEGCSNSAGELGHLTLVSGGRQCSCPNRGCLEAYASGWAIAERAQEAVREDLLLGRALTSLAGTINQIDARVLGAALRSGDPLARKLIDETSQYLSAGITGIINAFNPCLLILGGGIIKGFPQFIREIEAHVHKRSLASAVAPLKIVTAALGDAAGVVGAAAFARHVFEGN